MIAALCRRCEKEIPRSRLRYRAKYCSRECQTETAQAEYRIAFPLRGLLPPATVGAIGELMVATDLLRRGFEVFRAVSASCSCDLALLRDGKLIRIEVRAGTRHPRSGNLTYSWRESDKARHDVLAVAIVASGEIIYKPEL